MGSQSATEMDAWLRGGGFVVTASERAARALVSAFHRARRADGLGAWPAPDIQPWSTFIREAWQRHSPDARLILNPAQEQSLWAEIIAAHPSSNTLLDGPRQRMAALAMEAHGLVCAYAPRLLNPRARTGWQQDPAAFSEWLAAFDEACRAQNLLSSARLPLELPALLKDPSGRDEATRPPLLLAGFDRLQPVQRELFDAWGDWQELPLDEPAAIARFCETPDPQSELTACALWCHRQLGATPHARILVISQDATLRRGEIERAFLRHANAPFEFSLGVPLTQIPLIHAAQLLLRWLTVELAEHELDWLFASGYIASPPESASLQAAMRALRRRGNEQPTWSLDDFFAQSRTSDSLASWTTRIVQTQQQLGARRPQSPLEWAELVPQLLEAAGWPGPRPLTSAEFQAARRLQQSLEAAASLGFDGRRLFWPEFLAALDRILAETLFAPESEDAPIQIAGPAESAGLTADAIWFLGASEDAWPAAAPPHPLLPLEVQRQFAMPHATSQLDWDLARAITLRLLASAPEVHFSYARQTEAVEARSSRLIAQFAGLPQPLPSNLAAPSIPAPLTVPFDDASLIPFPPGKVEGGAAVLTAQSQCPFKAFATARLAAHSWEPAQPALTPAQRGQLLHAALHIIWGGPSKGGIRTLADLQSLPDRRSFVARHVRRALQDEIRPSLRARLPRRYIELEEQRLIGLISEWLDYESARAAFEAVETEAKHTIPLAGLVFDLRLDRIDRLNDGTLLVIDYKSGDVSPKSWDLPRPDDVQLPLYAGFALGPGAELGGLTFARLRPGDLTFAGRIGDARSTLRPNLAPTSDLVRNPFTAEQLIDWRNLIEDLARAFLAGRADVDPRDPPATCKACGLQTLCRIHEHQLQIGDEDTTEVGGGEGSDE